MQIISITDRHNEERDVIISKFASYKEIDPNEEMLSKCLMLGLAVEVSDQLTELIKDYFKITNEVLTQTEKYIGILQVLKPIPIERDVKSGEIIFDKVTV